MESHFWCISGQARSGPRAVMTGTESQMVTEGHHYQWQYAVCDMNFSENCFTFKYFLILEFYMK